MAALWAKFGGSESGTRISGGRMEGWQKLETRPEVA